MSFLLSGLACSLAIFCYVQNEITASKQQRTTQSILSNLSYLNDLECLINSNDGFAYAFTKNSDYPILFDPYFNFSTKGLIIFRVVEYCQLSNKKQRIRNISYQNLPKNIWLSILINNSFGEKIKSLKMTHHSFSSKFFEGKRPTKIFYPSAAELYQFRQSEFGKSFKYIGNGWFYHFGNKKSNSNIYNEHFVRRLFNECSIGDVRIRFGVYAPPNISVIGWKKNSKLKIRHDINGRKYGTIREGKYSAQELLDYSNKFHSNEAWMKKMKKLLKDQNLVSNSRFGYILNEFFPYKIFAFFASFTLIIFFSSSPIYFLVNLMLFLDINICFRSVVNPNTHFASDSFWGSLAFAQLGILLYIFIHERTSEVAYVSIYSMTIFIILFQSKDIFHTDECPFVLMNNKKNMPINSTNSS